MKKFLLSIAALAMSLTVSAQVDVQHQKAGVVKQCPYFAQQSVVVQKVAKKIAANQRWLGYYNSDALAGLHNGITRKASFGSISSMERPRITLTEA